ncbi:MAG: hypothetical protein WCA35_06175 [Kovacikia sp.]
MLAITQLAVTQLAITQLVGVGRGPNWSFSTPNEDSPVVLFEKGWKILE